MRNRETEKQRNRGTENPRNREPEKQRDRERQTAIEVQRVRRGTNRQTEK